MAFASLAPLAAHAQGYVNTESELGSLKWVLYAMVAAVLAVTFVAFFRSQTGAQRSEQSAKRKQKVRLEEFRERAAALGFKQGESKTLERIAGKVSPKSPHNLLLSASGREYLMADLGKRVTRREREIKLLDRIVDKLKRMREADVHEREYLRVEADLPIWVIPKKREQADDLVALAEDEAGEDFFENLESVKGKLLDISEGGAALEVDLNTEKGDVIEFWSADNRFVLSTLAGGVVSVSPAPSAGSSGESTESPGSANLLHVHFIDPDLRELRLAIADLKARVETPVE
jgi:hypothetical protein